MRDIYAEGITKIGNALGLKGRFLYEFGFDQIMDIIAPPPEVEDVLLEQWAIVAPSGYVEDLTACEATAIEQTTNKSGAYFGYAVVKLTGSFQRPKRVKVEKRVKIGEVKSGPCGGYYSFNKEQEVIPVGANVYAEWEE